jgi:hypothetical protein
MNVSRMDYIPRPPDFPALPDAAGADILVKREKDMIG